MDDWNDENLPQSSINASVGLNASIDVNAQGQSLSRAKELEVEKKDEEAETQPVSDALGETRIPRVGRRPVVPTKAEIEAHFPLRLHFRSWWSDCNAGKARLAQHRVESEERERLGVTLSADYAFMGSEEYEKGMQPTLMMHDDGKEAFWALGVSKKGVTEPIVKWCADVIDQSGYVGQRITFKTDQEPSILALN